MEPEIGLYISIFFIVIGGVYRLFGKKLIAFYNKSMENLSGKIAEQQEIRDDRQKNIEWLRTQLIDEENNSKKEIHAYKEEVTNLMKQLRETTISLSQAESGLIISEAEKKVLIISNEQLLKQKEELQSENKDLEKRVKELEEKLKKYEKDED